MRTSPRPRRPSHGGLQVLSWSRILVRELTVVPFHPSNSTYAVTTPFGLSFRVAPNEATTSFGNRILASRSVISVRLVHASLYHRELRRPRQRYRLKDNSVSNEHLDRDFLPCAPGVPIDLPVATSSLADSRLKVEVVVLPGPTLYSRRTRSAARSNTSMYRMSMVKSTWSSGPLSRKQPYAASASIVSSLGT